MKNCKLFCWAIVDSLGVLIYVSLVSFVMFNGEKFFGKADNFTGSMMILLLFVISAVITGSLFMGRPVYLYLSGFKKEGIKLFFYTLASLTAATIIIFAVKIF